MNTSERRTGEPEHISSILERVIADIKRKAEENENGTQNENQTPAGLLNDN